MTSEAINNGDFNYKEVETPKGLILASLVLSALASAFLIWLIYGREVSGNYDVGYLAAVNAFLNACSAACLINGFRAIKKGQWKLHRNFMLSALTFSALFLISYIIYHSFHGDTKFAGVGTIRYIYLSILASHIILSIVCLPMILTTVGLSLYRRFPAHKKWARFTFPIWTYVSVTGVVVFFMLRIFGSA